MEAGHFAQAGAGPRLGPHRGYPLWAASKANAEAYPSFPLYSTGQICTGVQDLLNSPNNEDPAQTEAFQLYRKDKVAYEKKIREVAKQNTPRD